VVACILARPLETSKCQTAQMLSQVHGKQTPVISLSTSQPPLPERTRMQYSMSDRFRDRRIAKLHEYPHRYLANRHRSKFSHHHNLRAHKKEPSIACQQVFINLRHSSKCNSCFLFMPCQSNKTPQSIFSTHTPSHKYHINIPQS